MNRYTVIDYKDNTIYSLARVNIEYEENEEQTSSITCLNRSNLHATMLHDIKDIEGIIAYSWNLCNLLNDKNINLTETDIKAIQRLIHKIERQFNRR